MKHVIFLRGLARESGHWAEFPGRFKEKIPCELHLADLPGAGSDRLSKCPLSVSQMVDRIRARESLPKKYSILGISLGGMLAMDWAARFPAEVESIVLINTSARNLSPVLKRLTPEALVLFSRVARIKSAKEREICILDFITNHFVERRNWLSEFTRIAEERPVTRQNSIRQLIAASLFRVRPIQAPVLVLRGLGDKLASPTCSENLARYFKAPLESHPTAGHDLPLDAPLWVVEKILNWKSF